MGEPQTRAAFWPWIVAAILSWGRGLERQSREPFWRWLGKSFGEFWGGAQGTGSGMFEEGFGAHFGSHSTTLKLQHGAGTTIINVADTRRSSSTGENQMRNQSQFMGMAKNQFVVLSHKMFIILNTEANYWWQQMWPKLKQRFAYFKESVLCTCYKKHHSVWVHYPTIGDNRQMRNQNQFMGMV